MNIRLGLIIGLCFCLGWGCKRDSAPKGGGAGASGLFGSGPLPGEPVDREKLVKLPSGLQYAEIQEGIGETPREGQIVAVRFRGYLPDGTEFDSSYKTGQPVRFILQDDVRVMPAWIEGVRTMKPGGKRKLLVPPALGFGEGGRPPVVPRLTPIVVDLELLRAFDRQQPRQPRQAGRQGQARAKQPSTAPGAAGQEAPVRPASGQPAPATRPADGT